MGAALGMVLTPAFTVPSFRTYSAIAFIRLRAFNGVATWIEAIVRPRGFDPQQAGTLGAILSAILREPG